MEPIWKGKQANKTSNTCTGDKGKQTNKQVEAAHAEAWMQGVVWSCITCRVQYAMHQKSTEFDMQGHTLTRSSQFMFSVKKHPHKEMLYSLERPHLYNPNALINKPN